MPLYRPIQITISTHSEGATARCRVVSLEGAVFPHPSIAVELVDLFPLLSGYTLHNHRSPLPVWPENGLESDQG